jgi:hypothetical protein
MGDFDWGIFARKAGRKALFGAIFGGLTELSAFLGTEPVPTGYVWLTTAAVLVIEQVLNAIKHSYLTD